jgi:hypothetical protein
LSAWPEEVEEVEVAQSELVLLLEEGVALLGLEVLQVPSVDFLVPIQPAMAGLADLDKEVQQICNTQQQTNGEAAPAVLEFRAERKLRNGRDMDALAAEAAGA